MPPKKKKKKKTTPIDQSPDSDIHELAKSEKVRGNSDFHKGNYSTALISYTKAIALSAKNPVLLVSLFTNRAITHLRSKDYLKAIEDCRAALKLDGKCLKAFICRGFAEFFLGHYDQAFSDFEAASREVPLDNKFLQQNLQKLKETLLLRKKESTVTKLNSTNLEPRWVGEFGLLNIDEEDFQSHILNTSVKENATKSYESSDTKKEDKGPPDLPLLVPIGEALLDDSMSPCFIESPKKEAEELALKEKEWGNRAFSEGNYLLALIHYSKAIRLNWRESVFFSNRALVYLKLNRFYESISDCTASIDRKPSIKAYARRAAAWASLQEFFLAAEDYKRALKFEPRNQDCLCELEKCLVHLEDDYRHKLEMEPTNEKLRKSLHNVREDLKKKLLQKLIQLLR